VADVKICTIAKPLSFVALLLFVPAAPAQDPGAPLQSIARFDQSMAATTATTSTNDAHLTAAGSTAMSAAPCPCPTDCRPGLFGGADYLFIRPHFSEAVGFATVTDTLTPTGLRRVVAAHELDFDYESSFRFFLGYHLNECADIRLTYWHLDADSSISGAGFFGQTIVDPFGNIGLGGTTIEANASVQMNVFDLECMRRLEHNFAGVGFLYSAGLRFADVNQFYSSTILDGNFPLSDSRFDVDFTGVGPYLSLTGETGRGSPRPLSLFAKGAMALLVGQYDISTEVTVPGVFGSQSADRVRTVPVLESELGMAWRPTDSIRVSAGWLFQAWFNLGASGGTFDGERLPVGAVDTAFGGADDADIMSFDGLFVRTEINF
jgi:hypothetical protein